MQRTRLLVGAALIRVSGGATTAVLAIVMSRHEDTCTALGETC